jgi:hypothetical protein
MSCVADMKARMENSKTVIMKNDGKCIVNATIKKRRASRSCISTTQFRLVLFDSIYGAQKSFSDHGR